ncbi:hypothetical protein [Bradyrhizobium sp. LA6.10]|uniref:hypothetical protein n=1 Tax=Bradyrhizobium sp. LA6.10 TaxID=3156318 RepID=UPI003393165E
MLCIINPLENHLGAAPGHHPGVCPRSPASADANFSGLFHERHASWLSANLGLAGAVLLTMLIHGCARFKAECNDDFRPLQEPNLIVVAIAVAVLMTFFQWLITTDG